MLALLGIVFVPILVAIGIAGLSALVMGCGSSEEKKPDAGPAPDAGAPRQCQGTTLPSNVKPGGEIVDAKSVDTFNLVWPGSIKSSNIENWSPRGRLYFGAPYYLLQPTCTFADKYASGAVANHRQSIGTFLGNRYAKPFDASEEAILALTAGFADPAKATDVRESWRVLGEQTPNHKDFAELMTASLSLNEAFANASNRFTAPVASAQTDRKAAAAALQQWDTLLQAVNPTKLDDREFEYYRVLTAAADRFKKSLGGCTGPNCGGGGKDGGVTPVKDAGGKPPPATTWTNPG